MPVIAMPAPLSSIPSTMAVLQVVQTGRPPVLEMVERTIPALDPGEVLLRMDACGFCHHDFLVMAGTLRRGVAEGVTLGHEVAGTVVRVADDATGLRPGDRVVSLLTAACGTCARCRAGREHRCLTGAGVGHGRDGGFAQYVALPATALIPIPDTIPAERAALLACPAGVALSGIEALNLAPGETVVVTGAGGGLGAHAVQLAAMEGAEVIAVTTSPAKTPELETMGASLVIEAEAELDIADIVMAVTEDVGADAVLDTVGPPLWPAALRCLGQYGRLALLGDVTGEATPLRLAEVIFRDLHIIGVSGVSRATLGRAVGLAETGRLQPVVSQTLPLTEDGAMEAWRLVSERRALGRVVLMP